MKTLAHGALAATALVNGALGYAGQIIADQMSVRLQTYGATVPGITELALKLPPVFYVLGVASLFCAMLGGWRVIADAKMLCATFVFLFFDIGLLLTSHFAFAYVATRM